MLRFVFGIFCLFALLSCKMTTPEIMTPTILCNGLIKAAFDKDSTYFLERIENPAKLRASLKFYKDLRESMREYEELVMADNSQHDRMKDSALIMYKNLIDSIQKFGIKRMVFDTVDFNNYVNNFRPYYKLDAEGFIFQNQDTFILQVKEAFLLSDGWNLGSVKLFKLRPNEMLIRVIDSLKEASKVDPKNLRTLDSLKKINYQVKENPFIE